MTLRLNGSSSGYTEIDAPAVAGNNSITLPTGNGSANQFLKNGSTAGTLSWSSMVETATGIGIGTSSPDHTLDVYGSFCVDGFTDSTNNYITLRNGFAPSISGGIGFKATNHSGTSDDGLSCWGHDGISFYTGQTERVRMDNSGNFMVGTTTAGTGPTRGFNVTEAAGQTYSTWGHLSGTSAGQPWCVFSYNGGTVGSITQNGTTGASYNTTSDYRLKENVIPLTGAIDRVNDLQVHRFNFISDPGRTVDGFIAHEAQAVVPEAITGEKDAVDADGNPIYQGIDQSKLVPLLTAALQEAIAKIEVLEAKVAALEAQP